MTPIFASAHFRDGGLNLKTSELALPMAAGGIALTLFALLVYPRLQPRLGMLWSCRSGLLLMVPTALLVPVASLFISSGSRPPGEASLWPWRNLMWANVRRRRWRHRWQHWQHSQHHQSFQQYVESQARRPWRWCFPKPCVCKTCTHILDRQGLAQSPQQPVGHHEPVPLVLGGSMHGR